MRRKIRNTSVPVLLACTLYILLLIFPQPLFSHHYEYEKFNVYSDQAIPEEIKMVIVDVKQRLSKSELYTGNEDFNIFICQKIWRFKFFTRNGKAGGVVNGVVSPNAFIRTSNISLNEIIPPDGWMFSRKDRTLSYFIAHELTHSLQSMYNRFLILDTPSYILEGYADYIGKGSVLTFDKLRRQYLEKDFVMDIENGLYNRYHLYIAYLIEHEKMSFVEMLEEKPTLKEVLSKIE